MRFEEPAMRPPQEARSLLLRGTQGCSWNRCAFCYVSREHRFLAATPEEWTEEIRSLKDSFPPDTKVYVVGSNPFVLPAAHLLNWLEILRREIPARGEVSMQSRVADIAAKTDAELAELRAAGLAQLYVGVESGSDEVLAFMDKGQTAEETVTQLLRLEAAGIAYTGFYVFGLGGKGRGAASAEATAKLFNRLRPRRITSTGMTLFAGTPLLRTAREGGWTEATEREKIEEMLVFFSLLETDTFYDGIHYLNPLNYRFAVRDRAEKERVLADIRDVLRNSTDWELEKMVNRRLMVSL